MTWKIRDPWRGTISNIREYLLPDARESKDAHYSYEELHNAVWFSAPSPSDADEDSGEWFFLTDGRNAYLMTIDLDYEDDGSIILNTEEE